MNPKNSLLNIGFTKDNNKFLILAKALSKHLFIFGGSGSGKTVLGKAISEELALLKIPSIVIDTQGDLAALGLFDEKPKFNVRLFSPSGKFGEKISLSLFPQDFNKEDIKELALSLVKLIGFSKRKSSLYEAAFALIFNEIYDKGLSVGSLNNLIEELDKLDESSKVLTILSEKELKELIKSLRVLSLKSNTGGDDFNIDKILTNKGINIIYLKELDDNEQEFFLSVFSSKIYKWILKNPSESLRFGYFIDEVSRFLPAGSKKTPAKEILLRLLKEGRKFGLGVILSTQNPGDIDYKAFSQFGSLAIGRLTAKQDLGKIQEIVGLGLNQTSKLKPGTFFWFAPDYYESVQMIKVRKLITKHLTLSNKEIVQLYPPTEKNQEDYNNKKPLRNAKVETVKEGNIFPITLSKEELWKIINKNRKKLFVREELFDTRLKLYPLRKVKLICRSLFGLKENLAFIEVFNGNILNLESLKVFNLAPVWSLSRSELEILKALNYSKRDMEDLSKMLKKNKSAISKTVNSLKRKRAILNIEEKYQALTKIPKQKDIISNINLFNIDFIDSSRLYALENKKNIFWLKETIKNFANLKILYEKCDFFKESLYYFPLYEVKFKSDKGMRTINIAGFQGKIINI